MSFDKPTRNRLSSFVSTARDLITSEFEEQFQSIYGISAAGEIASLDRLDHLDESDKAVAALLRERIHYIEETHPTDRDSTNLAIARLAREQAFTILNRLAAIRMAEKRDIIIESVGKGYESKGFRVFQAVAGASLGDTYHQYRRYLFCLFDELAIDLGILFDRRSSQSLLFPREPSLQELLTLFQAHDLEPLWAEDETIGWIYQYYNDPLERKKMREESAAPRNSRELAVRNQFFTPRYVVEFLTDNTLGRIWYEMTQGQTRLTEQCRYLVRRPNEVFLQPGESVVDDQGAVVGEDDAKQTDHRPLSTDHSPTPFLRPADQVFFTDCRDWVHEVRTGTFTAAVEDATWDEISSVALAIDGYEAAEALGFGDVHQHVRPRWERLKKEGQIDDASLLEQWLLLFSVQRGVLREGLHINNTEYQSLVHTVWQAWIQAAMRESTESDPDTLRQQELLRQPVYIPHRPIKDPREIRLLDPACGSMHFGLYAFDLFEVIYEEAWEAQLAVIGGRWSENIHEQAEILSRISSLTESDGPSGSDLPGDREVSGGGDLRTDQPAATSGGVNPVEHGRESGSKPDATISAASIDRLQVADGDRDPDHDRSTSEISKTRSSGQSHHPNIRNREAIERLVLRAFEKANWSLTTDHRPLFLEYPSKQEFLKDVPRLIIEHNIHGIDIDPRATQIAGLSLWMRAQKSWQTQQVDNADRPRIRRSNVVCAEPMPGSEEMLEEFVATLDPPLLGAVVKSVFEKMKLAGEAGALLKIEEEIRSDIEEAKKAWEKLGASSRDLFSVEEMNKTLRPGSQMELSNFEKALASDFRPLGDDFWASAELRVIEALRKYAEQADAESYQKRLFADDAARGFAFIDLCRKRYDAVVMNPPFGSVALNAKKHIESRFEYSGKDMYSAFIERGSEQLITNGLLGAITSRSGLFLSSFTKWRTATLLGESPICLLADLGSDVLDAAMVETAAYIIQKQTKINNFTAVRLIEDKDKSKHLLNLTKTLLSSRYDSRIFILPLSHILPLPGTPIAYWASHKALSLFLEEKSLRTEGILIQRGLFTADDFRFVRLQHEIPQSSVRFAGNWSPFVKGGDNSKFYRPTELLILSRDVFAEISAVVTTRYEYLKGNANWVLHLENNYGDAGFTYTLRTSSPLALRVLPAGCYFANKGPAIFCNSPWFIGGLLNSIITIKFIELFMGRASGGARQYDIQILDQIPWPPNAEAVQNTIERHTSNAVYSCRILWQSREAEAIFVHPFYPIRIKNNLENIILDFKEWESTQLHQIQVNEFEINNLIRRAYNFKSSDQISDYLVLNGNEGHNDVECISECGNGYVVTGLPEGTSLTELMTYLLGTTYGRWDIRYATGELQAPELPDPFDPLPVCPPGMLQNADGLPAEPGDVPDSYPLRISWPGILVDEKGHSEDIVTCVREAIEVIWKHQTRYAW